MDGHKHYWFENRRIPLRGVQPGEGRASPYPALDARQFVQGGAPVLGTAPVFCFFRSADGAWTWLDYQLSRVWTGVSVSPVWVLQGTNDPEYLRAVCEEAINDQAILFEGFLIDPKIDLSEEASRLMDRERTKEAL